VAAARAVGGEQCVGRHRAANHPRWPKDVHLKATQQ
jgi:hypothetical protein